MTNADVLSFREFMMGETLPLATIHNAVLEFLRGRDDVAVFGAQAVNAYVDEPRMTQDIDLMSVRAEALARELRDHLSQTFHIAVRVRQLGKSQGYRLYQIRKGSSRHLVDLRPVDALPPAQRIAQILVVAPEALIASKVIAYHKRRGQPKSGTDWRDVAMLLLAFPHFKTDPGPVADRLRAMNADSAVFITWKEIVDQEIQTPDEDDVF